MLFSRKPVSVHSALQGPEELNVRFKYNRSHVLQVLLWGVDRTASEGQVYSLRTKHSIRRGISTAAVLQVYHCPLSAFFRLF